jgi:hypothetical protein
MLVNGQPPLPRDNTHEDDHPMHGMSSEEGNSGRTLIATQHDKAVELVQEHDNGLTFCKGNLTDLRRILHLSLAKGNPK